MLHVLYVWIIQCFSHPLMLGLFSQMIRLNRVEITGYGTLWDFNISHPFHSCCKGCDFCLFVCFMFKNQISHKADFFPQNQIFSPQIMLSSFVDIHHIGLYPHNL